MSEYLQRVAKLEQDAEQRAALYSTGSQVVRAGPGSGKTYLLTTKIAKTLLEATVRFPQKVACVTFSRRLAADLTGELELLGVYDPTQVYVGTIHSFCIAEIIMPMTHLLARDKFPSPFRIASDEESYAAINTALSNQNIGPVPFDKRINNIKTNLDNYRKHCFVAATDSFAHTTYEANGFSKYRLSSINWSLFASDYQVALMSHDPPSLDFVQVEMLALWLAQNDSTLAMTLAAAYPWLFIDEYQDLSPLFHQLITSLLAAQQITVFAIGDPNQCIYEELQGSKPHFLSELAQQIECATGNKPITLQTNYRSTQNIIDIGSAVLGRSTGYKASHAEPGRCHVIFIDQAQREEAVRRALRRLVGESNTTSLISGQVAVLSPRRKVQERLWQALEQDTSCLIAIDEHPQYPQKTELSAWLLELARWYAGGQSYFHKLIPFWLQTNRSIYGACNERQQADLVENLFSVLYALRASDLTLNHWLSALAEGLHLDSLLEDYARLRPGDVMEWRALYYKVNSSAECSYSVQQFAQLNTKVFLTTLHSSKGLEFDAAILLGLDEIIDSDSIPELKSRLAYVAVTRARTHLYVFLSRADSPIAQQLRKQPEHLLKCWDYRNGNLERRTHLLS
ncbi:MAG: hypothetical protein DCC55_32690 [Chloroflexi bacterium]|nr:MAG: hypothetical protein DCC55_32690 [Chloroflexota bacterium]